MIHPVICKEKSSTLIIKGDSLKRLKKKPKQILWVKDGIYGLIPIEVVKNALDRADDLKNVCRKSTTSILLKFHWNETVEIPQEMGRSMEVYNGGGK